jgi:oxygen-independent coproporphyrinogen-3 oxidase
MRGFVIERLMCDLAFPARELRLRYGSASEEILDEAQALLAADQDKLIECDGEAFRAPTAGGRSCVPSPPASMPTSTAPRRGTHRAYNPKGDSA